MHDQVTRLVKRPATLYTVMWLFTSMRAGLHGQAGHVEATCHIVYTDMVFRLYEYGGVWSGYQAS